MRYFTKELYLMEQGRNIFYRDLKVTKQAETFSEEYFQRLYNKEMKRLIALSRARSLMTADDMYPLDSPPKPMIYRPDLGLTDARPYMKPEEYEAERTKLEKRWRESHDNYVPDPDYSEIQYQDGFKVFFEGRLRLMPKLYPEIIDDVADIRVLALGRVSKTNYHKLKDNDDRIEKALKKADRDYAKAFSAMKNKIPDDILRNYNFHDCIALSADFDGKDFVIEFDNSGGFTKYAKVKYINAEIIEDEGIVGCSWLYDEFIENNGTTEYHAMLCGRDGLRYLTIKADGVKLTFGENEDGDN